MADRANGAPHRADYVLFVGLEASGRRRRPKRQRKDVSSDPSSRPRGTAKASQPSGDVVTPVGRALGQVQARRALHRSRRTAGRTCVSSSRRAGFTSICDVSRDENHVSAAATLVHARRSRGVARPEPGRSLKSLWQRELTDYLGLRDYQVKAIHAVEEPLASSDAERGRGKSSTCLIAMATGTGKTRTFIGLVYRLVKSKRFRRVLFLVDRTRTRRAER